MTTIAYRDGVMAGDSASSSHGELITLGTKLYRLSSGAIVGQAGDEDCRDLLALLDKVRTPAGLPSKAALMQMGSDQRAMLVFPRSERIFVIDTDHASKIAQSQGFAGVYEISFPFHAIGSGSALARGAMAAGAKAIDAVRIGCRFDNQSSTPVTTMLLHPAPATPKTKKKP